MKSKLFSLCFATTLALAGCSDGGSAQPEQTGGSGSGGGSQTGGNSGKGGSGGAVGQGGTTSAGGTTSNGGSTAAGGTTSSGGAGSGGASSSGGKVGSGGATVAGGSLGSGGVGQGGSAVTGGTTGKGGSAGSDGAISTGGLIGSGGTSAKDGGVGGATGTGGSTGAGGSTVVSACGLPAGPSSGVAAPTGAGTKIDVLPWAGFKAATSFSLDDNNASQIRNYATLNGLGVKFTFYLITQSATDATWKQALKDGHELGNHTQNHSCGTASQGQSDLTSKLGVTAHTMAAPNGDTSCGSSVDPLNLLLNRGVNGGSISFTADDATIAKNLPTSLPPSGASASSLTSVIDGAYAKGEWQTFCIHGFSDPPGDSSAYQAFPLASLTDAVKTEKAKKDLWIDTMQAVGGYWRAGRAFAKATSTTSGTDKTWKWTVPKNNPPNTCLRVKTDGGVLKQKGATIPWDDHGYYEISFDAGEVTLSSQ